MTKSDQLKHHFLVAMPSLTDQTFGKSVIYLYEHNEEGAMGIIINKPMQISLGNVLDHLDIDVKHENIAELPVLMGGPVGQENGFVLHDRNVHNGDPLALSSSKEILKEIAAGNGPDHFIVSLGYAGWSPGQLEEEIQRNDWLLTPPNKDIIFNTPMNKRWQNAAALIGIDINRLSDQVGHA